jgi:hypothetical protein
VPLTRADVIAYLAGTLGSWLATAGIPATDTAGALKEPLDTAFRLLGIAEADLANPDLSPYSSLLVIDLATVTTLERVRDTLASQPDVRIGDVQVSTAALLTSLDTRLGEARARVAARPDGPILDTDGYIGTGRLVLPGGVSAVAS